MQWTVTPVYSLTAGKAEFTFHLLQNSNLQEIAHILGLNRFVAHPVRARQTHSASAQRDTEKRAQQVAALSIKF